MHILLTFKKPLFGINIKQYQWKCVFDATIVLKTFGGVVPCAVRCGCPAVYPVDALGCSELHKEGAQLQFQMQLSSIQNWLWFLYL